MALPKDKYVSDADTWAAHGETFGRAATKLFASGDPFMYFPAAILGHQALEMLLKAALIRQGFQIAKNDVWGHDLVELVNLLATNGRITFNDLLLEVAKTFTDFFNELRYPTELKNVLGLGPDDGWRFEYAIGFVLPHARRPKTVSSP